MLCKCKKFFIQEIILTLMYNLEDEIQFCFWQSLNDLYLPALMLAEHYQECQTYSRVHAEGRDDDGDGDDGSHLCCGHHDP